MKDLRQILLQSFNIPYGSNAEDKSLLRG